MKELAIANSIRTGATEAREPRRAANELCDKLDQERPALVMFFASPDRDMDILGAQISSRFPTVPVIGGTTSGEIGPLGYLNGALVGLSLPADEFKVATRLVTDIRDSNLKEGTELALELVRELGRDGTSVTPANTFGLLLVDGLSQQEELVVSALSRGLDGIHFVGGSVADGLRFQKTFVWHQGIKRSDAAVFALVRTTRAFEVFKTYHFHPTDRRVVVTKADPVRRLLLTLDGMPAAQRYAELLGLRPEELGSDLFSAHPLAMRMGGKCHLRAIQKVNPDGSFTLLSSVDTGIVLSLASSGDILQELDATFAKVRQKIGKPDLVIGFDCILRQLELDQKGLKAAAGKIYRDNRVLGFSTYGEQLDWMHVNQTFTGVAIGGKQS